MGSKIKTIAVIPCYNTAKTIRDLVEKTLPFVDVVIVVENDCTDNTFQESIKGGAVPVFCAKKGMGVATSTGISLALEVNPDYIVTLDGDGQHDPTEIPQLLQPLIDKKCPVVVGIRDGYKAMPRYRKFGNDIIRFTFNFGSKHQLEDAQCGFRAFTNEVAWNVRTREAGFGCITEFLIKCRKKHYKVCGVPVSCLYHKKLEDNSTMNPVKHGLGVLLSTIKWRLWEIFS